MSNGNGPLEKDYGSNYLDGDMEHGDALQRVRTAGSVSMSPELFEKLYLTPQNKVKGDLRRTVANPTPLALVGFLISLTPLSNDLMNWRGAQAGSGSAGIGSYFFFGGVLMILGGIGEFIVGNTFPMVVFCSFGAFWATFGATLQPFYSAYGNYAAYDTTAHTGLDAPEFNNAFGFFLLWMGVLCLVYLICSIRTNLVFVMIFFTLVCAFAMLTAGYFELGLGNSARASSFIIAGGAFGFVTCVCGWWIFLAILLASLDFPISIPVGDLSTVVKGASDKMK